MRREHPELILEIERNPEPVIIETRSA